MLRALVVAGCLVLAFPTVTRAQFSIPAAALVKYKAASVLIKVQTGRGWGSGSGFLFEKKGQIGLIATNAHVIVPPAGTARKIVCVFHSGQEQEFELESTTLGVDQVADLAVLSVNGPNLPDPLTCPANSQASETMPIIVLGFPFGTGLATSRRNPTITVSRTSISSLRPDRDGSIGVIQLDGGVDPGNSGGPAIDEQGNVVGVIQSKLIESRLSFAIPLANLLQMLNGDVQRWKATITDKEAARVSVTWDTELIDPKQRIVEGAVLAVRKDHVSFDSKVPRTTPWQPISPEMTLFPLDLQEGMLTGKSTFPVEKGKPTEFFVQIKVVRSDGRTTFTAPGTIDVNVPLKAILRSGELKPIAAAPTNVRGPTPNSPSSKIDGDVFQTSASITQVNQAGAGRFLILHLAIKNEAIVYDLVERKAVLTLPAMSDALIVGGKEQLVIVNTFDNSYSRWSLATSKKLSEGPFAIQGVIKAIAMGAAAEKNMLVCWQDNATKPARMRFSWLDIETMKFENLNGEPGSEADRKFAIDAASPVWMNASWDGKVFGICQPSLRLPGAMSLIVGRTPTTYRLQEIVLYAAPTADGMSLCTARGHFSVDFVRRRGKEICFPSTDPDLYLTLSREGGEVRSASSGEVVEVFPPLEEFDGDPAKFRGRLPVERRFLLVPRHQLLVTIPTSDDRLVIRKLKVPVRESKPDDSLPMQRTWAAKQGSFQTDATFLSLQNGVVRLRKPDGKEITVSLDKLSDADQEYVQSRVAGK